METTTWPFCRSELDHLAEYITKTFLPGLYVS